MTPKKCMSIAKSLTNTQHMDLEPLCTDLEKSEEKKCSNGQRFICTKVTSCKIHILGATFRLVSSLKRIYIHRPLQSEE